MELVGKGMMIAPLSSVLEDSLNSGYGRFRPVAHCTFYCRRASSLSRPVPLRSRHGRYLLEGFGLSEFRTESW